MTVILMMLNLFTRTSIFCKHNYADFIIISDSDNNSYCTGLPMYGSPYVRVSLRARLLTYASLYVRVSLRTRLLMYSPAYVRSSLCKDQNCAHLLKPIRRKQTSVPEISFKILYLLSGSEASATYEF